MWIEPAKRREIRAARRPVYGQRRPFYGHRKKASLARLWALAMIGSFDRVVLGAVPLGGPLVQRRTLFCRQPSVEILPDTGVEESDTALAATARQVPAYQPPACVLDLAHR